MSKIEKACELHSNYENDTSKVNSITTDTIIRVCDIVTHSYDEVLLIQEWHDYTKQIENVLKLVKLSTLSRCDISTILGDITGTHEIFNHYLHRYQPFIKSRDSWAQDMMTYYPHILGSLTLFIKTTAQNYDDTCSQVPIEVEVYKCNYNDQTAEDYIPNIEKTI